MPDALSLSQSELPEEIEKAMNGAILAECKSPRICSVNGRVTKGIRCGPCERQALQVALPRLTAAEAARDAALARVERLEKALEPFTSPQVIGVLLRPTGSKASPAEPVVCEAPAWFHAARSALSEAPPQGEQ